MLQVVTKTPTAWFSTGNSGMQVTFTSPSGVGGGVASSEYLPISVMYIISPQPISNNTILLNMEFGKDVHNLPSAKAQH